MSGWLDTPVLQVIEKGLDASSMRQKVLSNNVSNAETPGFKRSDVDFKKALDKAMGTSNTLSLKLSSPKHIAGVTDGPENLIVTDQSSLHNNGNNVDIDREMTNIAENGIYFNSLTRTSSMQLGIMRLLINQK